MNQCTSTKSDGSRCRGVARPSGFCWAHDPELRDKASAARKAGGENSSNVARAGKRLPKDLRDVLDRLMRALATVETGELDPRRATAMARLASAIVRTHEAGDVEQRLGEIEARLEAQDAWAQRSGAL